MTEERFQRLKRRAEEAKADADEARGAVRQIMKDLEREFGCKSVAEARKLLKKLERQAKQEESVLREEILRYEKEFGEAADD